MAVSKLISSLAHECIEARNRVSADIIKTPLIRSKLELSETLKFSINLKIFKLPAHLR